MKAIGVTDKTLALLSVSTVRKEDLLRLVRRELLLICEG